MIIVSACLCGVQCRYDAKSNLNEDIKKLVENGQAIPVCPEQLGGLTTPRTPCEIVCDSDRIKVMSIEGANCTKEFMKGAQETLNIAKMAGATKAILKSRSPSCGCGSIYDGSFSKTLKEGNGITVQLLLDNGIEVITEEYLQK